MFSGVLADVVIVWAHYFRCVSDFIFLDTIYVPFKAGFL